MRFRAVLILMVTATIWAGDYDAPKVDSSGQVSSVRTHSNGVGAAGPTGEVKPGARSQSSGAGRWPAIENLNAELQSLSDLPHDLEAKEHFFKTYYFIDDHILLLGEGVAALLSCKEGLGASTLVMTKHLNLSTTGSIVNSDDRKFSFDDNSLCEKSKTAMKEGPGKSKLIIVKTRGDEITDLTVR